MNKITPEMLASEMKSISLPEYDWNKQSRTDAFGTHATTNNSSWTNCTNALGQRYSQLDSSMDSISD